MGFALLLLVLPASALTGLSAQCAARAGCLAESGDDSLELLQQRAVQIEKQHRATQAQQRASVLANSSTAVNKTTPAPPTQQEADELEALGLSLNAAGDLAAFASATLTNVATILFCLAAFMVLRVRYPLMYSKNSVKEKPTTPTTPDPTALFSWVGASYNAGLEDWVRAVGLDNAMLLEFTQLAMKITCIVGIPMLFIMGPIHLWAGGSAAGPDHMSYLSMGNVKFGSWIYTVHAVLVWGVVAVVPHLVNSAQRNFTKVRFVWMEHLPEVRANTVLVGGISRKRQTDEELRAFFELIFPGEGRVKEAYVVKDTGNLPYLVSSWRAAKAHYDDAVRREGAVKEEAKEGYLKRMEAAWGDIQEARARVLEATKVLDERNCTNGFVTFSTRQDAEIALRLDAISKDEDKWDITLPPEPKDVLWRDLEQDPTAEAGRHLMGYALLFGLFLAYIPLIVMLTHVAKAVDMGPLQPFWEGLAPTFGLQFMIAFLPTFIILIFRLFFTLKADAFAQQKLQRWYFWFQVFFVILATAVGKDLTGFLKAVIESPLALFRFLGETMPSATHFYMNFMVLQWATHSMNMLRYVNLFKFKAFSAIYDDKTAAAMAEPEDQDYYGLGSRSARWSINLLIGIIFGNLCPPIYLLTFLNFACTRLFYGYLIVFAETRKPDTGGFLWVSQLDHMFVGLTIYVILMTGVLYERAPNPSAAWITASSFLYVAWSWHHFHKHMHWEKLPLKKVLDKEAKAPLHQLEGHYCQPELYTDYEEIKEHMAKLGAS